MRQLTKQVPDEQKSWGGRQDTFCIKHCKSDNVLLRQVYEYALYIVCTEP